jgi:hypothetical protein
LSLTTPTQRDIEQYIAEQTTQPVYFPPFMAALKPTSTKFRYRGIYIIDTSKPAWMDVNGMWRYADGSAV